MAREPAGVVGKGSAAAADAGRTLAFGVAWDPSATEVASKTRRKKKRETTGRRRVISFFEHLLPGRIPNDARFDGTRRICKPERRSPWPCGSPGRGPSHPR